MRTFRYIILSIALLLSTISAIAQKGVTVSGTVRDSGGQPVIGAVVMVEGKSSTGAVTNLDGRYTLVVPDPSSVKLSVSCISYKTIVEELAGRTSLDFVLEEDNEELEEVVVVGYGAMRRSDLTGSVTSVRIDEQEAGRSMSVDQLLQGRAAGVQVTSNNASPDGGVSIRVRGTSTFNADAQPLFVVDGIIMNPPTSSESLVSSTTAKGVSDEEENGLMGINPQDIASMEILKDASSTAIYGALGANGVVLITTKSASREKPVIHFNAGMDVANRYKKMEQMSFWDYVEYLEAKGGNASRLNTLFEGYVDPDNRGTLNVTPVDWQDYVMQTAVSQRYYFSISGKPKSISYSFSLGYNNKNGIIKTTSVDQYTIRFNVDKKLSKKMTLGAKVNLAYIRSNMTQGTTVSEIGSAASLCRSMLQYVPYIKGSLYDDDDDDDDIELSGDYLGGHGGPQRWLTDFSNKRREFRVIPNLYAQWNILPWLVFKSTIGGDYRNNDRLKFKSSRLNSGATGSVAALANYEQYSWNWDNLLTVNKKLSGGHSINGTLGVSARAAASNIQSLEAWNIDQWKALEYSMNSAPYASFAYSESLSSTLSYFARAVYNYKDRYVLTATGRFDGSSKFQGRNKFAFFPSFAFAWRINQEEWFDVPVVSMAKLRLGWGQVGNQAVSNYQTLTNYGSATVPSHVGDISYGMNVALAPSNLANPSLKWETTEQVNAGLDLSLWKGRLSFSADAYYKITRDLLQSKYIPTSSGFSTTWVNEGSISNRGLEFSISAVPVKTRDFEWSVDGNISFNRNRIESIDPTAAKSLIWIDGEQKEVRYFLGGAIGSGSLVNYPGNIYIEGYPMGLFYGLKTDGIVQVGQTGVPMSGTTPTDPGHVNYVDMNGDNLIDVTVGTTDDRTIIGNPNPDFTYGFSTALQYKRFSLSASFVGSYGNDVLNINRVSDDGLSTVTCNHSIRAMKLAWSPENPNTTYPSVSQADNNDRMYIHDRFVEDASYLRLSNVALTYDVPVKKDSKVLKGLSLTLAGGNLYVWTKYLGWDPEVNSYGSNLKKMGLDVNSYPGARTISFDVKFTF